MARNSFPICNLGLSDASRSKLISYYRLNRRRASGQYLNPCLLWVLYVTEQRGIMNCSFLNNYITDWFMTNVANVLMAQNTGRSYMEEAVRESQDVEQGPAPTDVLIPI